MLKRKAFGHEKEFRLIIVPNDNCKSKGAPVIAGSRVSDGGFYTLTFDWSHVINNIYIDSLCHNEIYNLFCDICRENSLPQPQKYDLYGKSSPVTIIWP